MSTATTTSADTGQHITTRGRQREAQQPVTQQERSAAQRLRTTMAAVMWCPWLSLLATRSRGYASGPPEDACRRIGRACIRGRMVAVAVGCGGWCGLVEAGVKTPRGAGPRWRPAPLSLAGFAVSGPLATPPHRIAAACQTGEGHDVRGGFGDGGDARFKVPKPDQPQPLGASR
jgi:hypothetical protein